MKRLLALSLGVFLSPVLFETCCQIYAMVLAKTWEKAKSSPGHYCTRSEAFGYALKPGFEIVENGRELKINKHGIREAEERTKFPNCVAILGDSVVFGIGLSQEETISSFLQKKLNEQGGGAKVLNFGTPGYGLQELNASMKALLETYEADRIVYVLNLNDFSRRNSVYEGADNGVYRMYAMPVFKSPWFVRKAIYRLKKEGGLSSAGWYRWLYEGNKKEGCEIIRKMASNAKAKDASFSVFILPAGVAYGDGSYDLADVHAEIRSFLEESGIDCIDPTELLMEKHRQYFDGTDHFTVSGCERAAEIIARFLIDLERETQ